MNCTCRTDIEAELTEIAKTEYPLAKNHRVDLMGYGFAIVANKLLSRPFMAYEAIMDAPTKVGGTKVRKIKGTMVFSFCPFCGVNLKQDVAKTEEASL